MFAERTAVPGSATADDCGGEAVREGYGRAELSQWEQAMPTPDHRSAPGGTVGVASSGAGGASGGRSRRAAAGEPR